MHSCSISTTFSEQDFRERPSSLLILTPKGSAANLEKNAKERKRLLQKIVAFMAVGASCIAH